MFCLFFLSHRCVILPGQPVKQTSSYNQSWTGSPSHTVIAWKIDGHEISGRYSSKQKRAEVTLVYGQEALVIICVSSSFIQSCQIHRRTIISAIYGNAPETLCKSVQLILIHSQRDMTPLLDIFEPRDLFFATLQEIITCLAHFHFITFSLYPSWCLHLQIICYPEWPTTL